MYIAFEWDVRKAALNLRKHGISFDTALRVFADPLAASEMERIEQGEERWQTMGRVSNTLLLVVAHTLREEDQDGTPREIIRLISDRQADRKEKRRYEQAIG